MRSVLLREQRSLEDSAAHVRDEAGQEGVILLHT